MKMIWSAALAATILVASPVAAQEAAGTNKLSASEEVLSAFAMSMMCLEATTSMAIRAKQDSDNATYDKLTGDGALWLSVAESFAADLGRAAKDELNGSLGRILAESNLLGEDIAFSRQKQVFDACNAILNKAEESTVK